MYYHVHVLVHVYIMLVHVHMYVNVYVFLVYSESCLGIVIHFTPSPLVFFLPGCALCWYCGEYHHFPLLLSELHTSCPTHHSHVLICPQNRGSIISLFSLLPPPISLVLPAVHTSRAPHHTTQPWHGCDVCSSRDRKRKQDFPWQYLHRDWQASGHSSEDAARPTYREWECTEFQGLHSCWHECSREAVSIPWERGHCGCCSSGCRSGKPAKKYSSRPLLPPPASCGNDSAQRRQWKWLPD